MTKDIFGSHTIVLKNTNDINSIARVAIHDRLNDYSNIVLIRPEEGSVVPDNIANKVFICSDYAGIEHIFYKIKMFDSRQTLLVMDNVLHLGMTSIGMKLQDMRVDTVTIVETMRCIPLSLSAIMNTMIQTPCLETDKLRAVAKFTRNHSMSELINEMKQGNNIIVRIADDGNYSIHTIDF